MPARVIDELMAHQADRRSEREGSMIGTRYRHMIDAMQARAVAVITERPATVATLKPREAGRSTKAGGLTRGGSCGFVVQSCCAAAARDQCAGGLQRPVDRRLGAQFGSW